MNLGNQLDLRNWCEVAECVLEVVARLGLYAEVTQADQDGD